MCRVPLVCVPCLPVFLLVCVLCRPVCWTSLHPFEIFLLACDSTSHNVQYPRIYERFFACVGGASFKCVSELTLNLKVHKPASKKISNGCRDVQHTGLQRTQTRRNTGKQGTQTRGTRHIFPIKHPYISGCMIIVGYANQFKVNYKN